MAKECLTDSQVEAEIERLTNSEYVRIARAELRAKYRRRQYLYTLRSLEKRGMQLSEHGMNEEYFEGRYAANEDFSE